MIAVVGAAGMLGSALCDELSERGLSFIGLTRSNLSIEWCADQLAEVLKGSEVVINALAFTDVDAAESNESLAREVNGQFVKHLAAACRRTGARLFHVSTDYVFDGMAQRPYQVADQTNPGNAYGRSKLLGEAAVFGSGCKFTIFRTSALYGVRGKNFPKTIARRLIQGDSVSVVADQTCVPTWAHDVAKLMVDYLAVGYGPQIVHATASGSCSWFEFAREIAISIGVDPDTLVHPVSSARYKSAASRPKFSVLDNTEGPIPPIGDWQARWQVAAPEVLASLD